MLDHGEQFECGMGLTSAAAFFFVSLSGLAAGMENRALNPNESYLALRLSLAGLFPSALGTGLRCCCYRTVALLTMQL